MMTTRELVDRMRTCAAALGNTDLTKGLGAPVILLDDAVKLLTEGADELDRLDGSEDDPVSEYSDASMEELVEAMKPPPPTWQSGVGAPVWGGDLQGSTARCPQCGSVHPRTVRRVGSKFVIHCQDCSNLWEYGR